MPPVGEPVALPASRRVVLVNDRLSGGPEPFDENALDDFDRYERVRVDYYGHHPLAGEVGGDLVGVRDLDTYGNWVSYHGGRYWHPRYRRGWRRSSRGYWSYVSGYGYNWVNDEPWGYCTSHYGRWAYYPEEGGWCWAPQRVWAPCYTRWCDYNDYYGWAPLDPWDRPVFGVGAYIGGGGFIAAGITLDFGSWSFCRHNDFFYNRPALLAVGTFGFGGGYWSYTGDRIRINRTSIRNVRVVNNVYEAVGVPRDPVRGLAVGRDGSLARSTVARVDGRIRGARAAAIQRRFNVAAGRDQALTRRQTIAERALRDPRRRLDRQAVVRGGQARHAFQSSVASRRALAAAEVAGGAAAAHAALARNRRANAGRLAAAGRPGKPGALARGNAAQSRQAAALANHRRNAWPR